jgi:riboflavin kinase/FMN adenylyltransferase
MKPTYTLHGVVQHGNSRGKELGFPTLNFPTEHEIDEGVYLSKTLVQNIWYNSLTFIGTAKTFDEQAYLAETYILDFNRDIYGETVTVTLLKKLRGNIKFPSVHELVEQMKTDEKDARKFFLSNSHNTNVY